MKWGKFCKEVRGWKEAHTREQRDVETTLWVQYSNCKTLMTCECAVKRNWPRGRIWHRTWWIHKCLRTISDQKQAALLLCVSDERLSFQMWWHTDRGTKTCADEMLSLMSSANMVILNYESLWELKPPCVLPIGNYLTGSVSPLHLLSPPCPPELGKLQCVTIWAYANLFKDSL